MGLFFVIQVVTISKSVMPFKIRHVFKVTSCIKTDVVMCCVTICLKRRRPYQCLTFVATTILIGLPSYCAGHPCSGILDRGGSRISVKRGSYVYKCVGVRFADFIPIFLNIP